MFVLRFVKLLNEVANQKRTWDRLFCIANLGLYKGCWGGEMVALTAQARIQTDLPLAGLWAQARSKVSWLHHQIRANPSPGSSKRGISTLKLNSSSQTVGQEKNEQSRKEGALLQGHRHQARTPYFSSSARQPNPISIQGDGKKKKKKKPMLPTHMP